MKRLPAAFFLFALSACATTSAKLELVERRAPFDLSCDASKVRYHEIGNDTWGASGCSKRVSYIVECRGAEAASCKAIMNSDSKKE